MRIIDGDALEELFRETIGHIAKRPEINGALEHLVRASAMAVKMIKDAPTIDAAPVKHGKWLPVLNGIDDDSNPAFDCSECDAMCRKQYNYCPRCGAKMDLEE